MAQIVPSAQIVYINTESYMWDELTAAVWLDPGNTIKEEQLYMDGEIDHGAGLREHP